MKIYPFCLLAATAVTLHSFSQEVSRKITDNGRTFYYNTEQGMTPSYVAYFGKKFPHKNMVTLSGMPVYKDSLNTKVVVYNFWFVRCRPCIAEIPALNKLADLFSSDRVLFIGITFDDSSTLQHFFKKNIFRFQQVSMPQDSIWMMKKFSYYPMTFIINRRQEISFVQFGRAEGKHPDEELTRLLAAKIRRALEE
jgi:peroxiredoxin